MLTPLEIKNKTFKGGLSYNKRDVDAFMLHVLKDYEELYRTNKELDEKNNSLASNLAAYKTIEKQLEKSLVIATKAAEDVRNEARAEAKLIEEKAKSDAKKIVENAKLELLRLEKKIDDLTLAYEKYKSQIKSLAFSQIELMDNTAFQFEKVTSSVIDELMSKRYSEAMDSIAEREAAASSTDENQKYDTFDDYEDDYEDESSDFENETQIEKDTTKSAESLEASESNEGNEEDDEFVELV